MDLVVVQERRDTGKRVHLPVTLLWRLWIEIRSGYAPYFSYTVVRSALFALLSKTGYASASKEVIYLGKCISGSELYNPLPECEGAKRLSEFSEVWIALKL